jgi:multiple sugar transport system substrate-binding protein
MNPDERLRRELREALHTDPGSPVIDLRRRIMAEVGARRRPSAARLYLRQRPWVPGLAALIVVLVVVELVNIQRAQVMYVGRVEFLATNNVGRIEFLSSQAQPADEYRAMTKQVLAGFNGIPDFNSQPTAAQDIARIGYERAAGSSTVDLVAMTQSEMTSLQATGDLEDLTPLLQRLQQDRTFPQALLDSGRFGTDKQYFIPWLQVTYMLVVNRKALQYLAPGVDVDHLTYDELISWGQRMKAATGRKLVGLPADPNGPTPANPNAPTPGLMQRFLQGYMYPSFTGTTLTGFSSPEAVQMWQTMRNLWSVTSPMSTTYTKMQDPLTTDEVWVAWDHQARLEAALADPQQFLAVPAPSGPRGLGYMSAVVGLAIPKGARNPKGAEALIDWLTGQRQQAAAGASLGFSPVVQGVELSGPLAAASSVANAYESDRHGIASVPPAGLGDGDAAFTGIYQETFARIVLQGEDITTVLGEEAAKLQQVVDNAKARCWQPDPPSRGPCQIK